MFGDQWQAYFESNTRTDRAWTCDIRHEVPPELRRALIDSLAHFQLGEAAGGRIHSEITVHPDPALDHGARRAIQLYIEEEWRHSRELASIIHALGGDIQTRHWTNDAFTIARRILGLRTKLITLAVGEVVGIVYYRALARGAGSPTLAQALTLIADEEAEHLNFQAAFFAHAVDLSPPALRGANRLLLQVLLFGILTCALATLWIDHGPLLRRLDISARAFTRKALHELRKRKFLASGAHTPRTEQAHGRKSSRRLTAL